MTSHRASSWTDYKFESDPREARNFNRVANAFTFHDRWGAVRRKHADVESLALHLLADWRPWMPRNSAVSLVPILWAMAQVSETGHWVAHREMAQYEKQWKGVASWMLGVAFCREVIEQAGLHAIPVSIVVGDSPIGLSADSPWQPFAQGALKNGRFQVSRVEPGSMPDFLVYDESGRIGFYEAKGTRRWLAASPPGKTMGQTINDWRIQVENAQITARAATMPVMRRVVATRVKPDAVGTRTRHVYVREWCFDDRAIGAAEPTPAERERREDEPRLPEADRRRSQTIGSLLSTWSIANRFGLSGVKAVAAATATALVLPVDSTEAESARRTLRDRREGLRSTIRRELWQRTNEPSDDPLLLSLEKYSLGGDMPQFSIGVTRETANAMDRLADTEPEEPALAEWAAASESAREPERGASTDRATERVAVRRDGVALLMRFE